MAREVIRLVREGAELFDDERGCMDHVAKETSDAFGRGEQWATEYVTTLVHRTIAGCVERKADPAAEVARVLRIDRTMAERWAREASAH